MGKVWVVRLRYTSRALLELEQILTYLSRRSPQGTINVHTRIKTIIALLLEHPEIGQLTRHGRMRRIVAVPYPYLIFYRITDDEIIILGIKHSAKKPSSMPGA